MAVGLLIILTSDYVTKQSGKTEILQQKTYVKVGLLALTRPNWIGCAGQISSAARKQKEEGGGLSSSRFYSPLTREDICKFVN